MTEEKFDPLSPHRAEESQETLKDKGDILCAFMVVKYSKTDIEINPVEDLPCPPNGLELARILAECLVDAQVIAATEQMAAAITNQLQGNQPKTDG